MKCEDCVKKGPYSFSKRWDSFKKHEWGTSKNESGNKNSEICGVFIFMLVVFINQRWSRRSKSWIWQWRKWTCHNLCGGFMFFEAISRKGIWINANNLWIQTSKIWIRQALDVVVRIKQTCNGLVLWDKMMMKQTQTCHKELWRAVRVRGW